MEDVIFNGTETRSQQGMAEVSITVDNSSGAIPIDYREVVVTRRLYRSGESEYLLNKVSCRLRDIVELFMDTGLSKSAYSVIGQGQMDLVLSSKPEERRFLFEEAAGIVKYRTRQKAAMRKLESAEHNLTDLTMLSGKFAARCDRCGGRHLPPAGTKSGATCFASLMFAQRTRRLPD